MKLGIFMHLEEQLEVLELRADLYFPLSCSHGHQLAALLGTRVL